MSWIICGVASTKAANLKRRPAKKWTKKSKRKKEQALETASAELETLLGELRERGKKRKTVSIDDVLPQLTSISVALKKQKT